MSSDEAMANLDMAKLNGLLGHIDLPKIWPPTVGDITGADETLIFILRVEHLFQKRKYEHQGRRQITVKSKRRRMCTIPDKK
jgi:hypothetical protein